MKTNRFFGIWLLFLAVVILLGIYAAVRILLQGHVLFNANDVIVWTLPLGVYVLLALASSGMTLIATIPQIFGLERYKVLTKRLVFMAGATLIGAFIAIGLELGSVLSAVYFVASPNPASPIWWMAVIYSIELVALIIKFLRIQANDWESGFNNVVGVVSFVAAVLGPLVLGSVFGFTESRSMYFGAFIPIFTLTIAITLGCAFVTLYQVVMQKVSSESTAGEGIFNELGAIFAFAAGLTFLFYLLRVGLKASATLPEFGTSVHFELVIGLAIPFIIMAKKAWRETAGAKLIAAGVAVISIMGAIMEILVSGLSRPMGPKAEGMPEFLSYAPSIWEWLVLLLAAGIVLFLYSVGEKYLQLSAGSK